MPGAFVFIIIVHASVPKERFFTKVVSPVEVSDDHRLSCNGVVLHHSHPALSDDVKRVPISTFPDYPLLRRKMTLKYSVAGE